MDNPSVTIIAPISQHDKRALQLAVSTFQWLLRMGVSIQLIIPEIVLDDTENSREVSVRIVCHSDSDFPETSNEITYPEFDLLINYGETYITKVNLELVTNQGLVLQYLGITDTSINTPLFAEIAREYIENKKIASGFISERAIPILVPSVQYSDCERELEQRTVQQFEQFIQSEVINHLPSEALNALHPKYLQGVLLV